MSCHRLTHVAEERSEPWLLSATEIWGCALSQYTLASLDRLVSGLFPSQHFSDPGIIFSSWLFLSFLDASTLTCMFMVTTGLHSAWHISKGESKAREAQVVSCWFSVPQKPKRAGVFLF